MHAHTYALSHLKLLYSTSKLKSQSVALQAALTRLFGEDVHVDVQEPESAGDNGDSGGSSSSSPLVVFIQMVLLLLCLMLLIVAVGLLIR